ncbi:hypothetical protein [Pseudomonas sp. PB120]|uniref:hypothetical protein n=1 Tax=Pseudomonas sp. PB120 TaxID=2494700 RepID=UPI0012FD5413|nr:hypothetical protein [Pseudomonas sp. PB120]
MKRASAASGKFAFLRLTFIAFVRKSSMTAFSRIRSLLTGSYGSEAARRDKQQSSRSGHPKLNSRWHCSSNAVNFNLEPLILIRGSTVASHQIELRIGGSKFMFGAVVTKMQTASTL